MPAWIKSPADEARWDRAQSLAEKQGQKGNWKYVTSIYKNLNGGKVAFEGFNMSQIQKVASRYLLAQSPVTEFQALLAYLRAMHWVHWTNHWQVKGDPQYGDHLLFQRMYEAIPTEIDDLAEKLVAMFGPEAVDAPLQVTRTQAAIQEIFERAPDDIFNRALSMEENLQQMVKTIFDAAEGSGNLSLGMNDYLAALANAHETNVYLLKQRLR